MARRALAAATATLLVAAAAAGLAFRAGGSGSGEILGSIWVANEGSGSLTVLDAATNEVAATLTGVPAPHNVQAGNGATVLATSAFGTALRFERDYHPTWELDAGAHPAHVIQLPRGDVYVTDEEGNAVSAFTAPALARTRIAVGRAPHGLRASPDGRLVVVANRESGTVTFVDASRREAVAEVAVGAEPVQVAFARDGRRVYVTLRGEDAVAEVDVRSRRVVGKTSVGRGPVQLHATPDGARLVVANQGTRERPGRTVSLVATAPLREVARIETGAGPHGVAVDPSGRRAYVTNLYSGTVSVLDLVTRREVAEIRTGDAPNGVTFSPLEPVHAAHAIRVGPGGGGHRH